MVKIMPEHMFKVIRSNIEIALTPPRIARLRSNLYEVSSRHRQYTANVQGQKSKVKVTGSKVKVTA